MRIMRKVLVFLVVTAFVFISACKTNNQALAKEEQEEYKARGATIIGEAQLQLSQALMTQIKDSGLVHALKYCSTEAAPLTQSVETKYNVELARVSLKYRNPKNKANLQDKEMLNVFQYGLDHEEELKPFLRFNESDSSVFYYAPIIMQPQCLQCHGTRDNGLDMATFNEIVELYPKDKAFNYQIGELRGMWKLKLD